MKIRVWEIILFTVLIVFAIIFSLLQKYWGGFNYFSSSIFLIFMIFFINNRIYYLKILKKKYDDGLETYFVELYNNGLITKEQFENVDIRIVNGYYKDYRRYKTLTIILLIVFSIILISIALVVFGLW